MKRLLTLLAAVLVCTAALCISASASDFDAAAQDLSAIGMFRGTVNGGFELDRAPKRSEAAIMLVRLYGAEEEAAAAYKSGTIRHPFKDVGPIASPYVAWLYTKGITKGTTATTFGSNATCTDKNYVVFLLRALGYQDGKDFQYATSLDFAEELGFYQSYLFDGPFLRDDLAAVTLQALATDKKGGKTYLLESLVNSGAVDPGKAWDLQKKIELYRALAQCSTSLRGVTATTSDNIDISGTVQYDGTTATAKTHFNTLQDVIYQTNGKVLLSARQSVDYRTKTHVWVKDGWLMMVDIQDGDTGDSIKFAVDDSADSADMQALTNNDVGIPGLAFVQSISSRKSNGNPSADTIYDVVVNGMAIASITDALEDLDEEEGMTLESIGVTDAVVSYAVDRNGRFRSMNGQFSAEIIYRDTAGKPMTMELDYELYFFLRDADADVEIGYFPDPSHYRTVDPDDYL